MRVDLQLTEKCSHYGGWDEKWNEPIFRSAPECPDCDENGNIPSQQGQELLDFIKRFLKNG